jgi:hypothetical protein
MKNPVHGILIMTIILVACNGNKSKESQKSSNNLQAISQTDNVTSTVSSVSDAKNTIPVKEIVSTYLQLKNALVKDNSADAATRGTELEKAFKNFDKNVLTTDQKKIFEDVEADAREHAEHIGQNSGNIEHQREHFEMLSNDMYDLIKTFSGGQVLYKEFCPMYNDGKGASWLSETKEIKNPYFGKKMLTCGTVTEELNQP